LGDPSRTTPCTLLARVTSLEVVGGRLVGLRGPERRFVEHVAGLSAHALLELEALAQAVQQLLGNATANLVVRQGAELSGPCGE
jgi:hypothetical protein